jgi:predicted TIM-barrel enzyme
MKRGLGEAPLAIASGTTPENISAYLDLATFFLVATVISRGFTEIDPNRLKALLDAAKRSHPTFPVHRRD